MTTSKLIFQSASYLMLLGVSSTYGYMAMPKEMGLSILAGALGLAFSNIDKISKFKGAGFEAEMNMVQTLIENQTEPSQEQKEKLKKDNELSHTDSQIFNSLQKNPRYTWRYAKTVADEILLPVNETESHLKSLMSRGLVKSGKGSSGEIWAITNLGKSVHEQYLLKNA